MILQALSLRNLPETEEFPFNLPLIKNLEQVEFTKPISFFVGENGSGKSTILEGIAAYSDLPYAGSMRMDEDPMLESAQRLAKWLYLRFSKKSNAGFFLRAEDFIGFVKNVNRNIQELDQEIEDVKANFKGGDINLTIGALEGERSELIKRYSENLDAMSHGEGFLKFFNARITGKGLYLIDEPEAALSAQRQLALMSLIKRKVQEVEAQFIIATHSPIILAMEDAEIFEFKEGQINSIAYKNTDQYKFTKHFLEAPEAFLKEL